MSLGFSDFWKERIREIERMGFSKKELNFIFNLAYSAYLYPHRSAKEQSTEPDCEKSAAKT